MKTIYKMIDRLIDSIETLYRELTARPLVVKIEQVPEGEDFFPYFWAS